MATLGEQLFTGARIKMKVGGTTVAHMTDVSVTKNYATVALEECGTPIIQGQAIAGVNVQVNAGFTYLVDPQKDPKAWGMIPAANDPRAIVTFKELDATLHDTSEADEPIVGKVIGMLPNGFTGMQANARGLVTRNLSWSAREFKSQAEL